MKSYYYFVRDLGHLRPSSFIYKVAVGTSTRELVKAELIRQYAIDCGMYFKPVSVDSDTAVRNAVAQWRDPENPLASPIRSAKISVCDLYRMIIDDSFNDFEANWLPSKFDLWLNFHHRPEFISSRHHSNVLQSVQPHKRKNLSQGVLDDGMKAAVAAALIIGLVILDAVVSNLCGF